MSKHRKPRSVPAVPPAEDEPADQPLPHDDLPASVQEMLDIVEQSHQDNMERLLAEWTGQERKAYREERNRLLAARRLDKTLSQETVRGAARAADLEAYEKVLRGDKDRPGVSKRLRRERLQQEREVRRAFRARLDKEQRTWLVDLFESLRKQGVHRRAALLDAIAGTMSQWPTLRPAKERPSP